MRAQAELPVAGRADAAWTGADHVVKCLCLRIESLAGEPMAKRENNERDRTSTREFKRRIKTQTVLPSAHMAAMLFWALLASGQINMRKVDGWHTLEQSPRSTN